MTFSDFLEPYTVISGVYFFDGITHNRLPLSRLFYHALARSKIQWSVKNIISYDE